MKDEKVSVSNERYKPKGGPGLSEGWLLREQAMRTKMEKENELHLRIAKSAPPRHNVTFG